MAKKIPASLEDRQAFICERTAFLLSDPDSKESIRKRIMKLSALQPTTGCREWRGRRDEWGYGKITILSQRASRHQKVMKVHVVAFVLFHGGWPIPKGQCVLHRCNNSQCCQVSHLYLGTQQENIQQASRDGRLLTGDKWEAAHLASIPRGENHPYHKRPELLAVAVQRLRGTKRYHGEEHSNSTITTTQALEIIRLKKDGLGVTEIGRLVGVSKTHAWAIANGKSWKHLHEDVS